MLLPIPPTPLPLDSRPSVPADRAHLMTETINPRSTNLHVLDVAGCVDLFVKEDAAVLEALAYAKPAITKFIEDLVPRFSHPQVVPPGRLIYLGAGTSGRLGVLDASEAPPTFCIPPDRIIGLIAGGDGALRKSSEGKEDDERGAMDALQHLPGGPLTPADTVVAIAAGGTTPYAVGALKLAKELARQSAPLAIREGTPPATTCLTALLCCTPCPTPADCDHHIVLPTGPEVLTGSTRMKAGSATKMALNIISTTLMVQTGRVHQNLMIDLRPSNAKLIDRAARIITHLTGLPRPEALALLEQARSVPSTHSTVKLALAAHWSGLPLHDASKLLDQSGGRLPAQPSK